MTFDFWPYSSLLSLSLNPSLCCIAGESRRTEGLLAMGIQGLLPMLKEISNSIHIRECKGQTYAVDAYVSPSLSLLWFHLTDRSSM